MIEIDDIKDRESLVTFLEELPQGAEADRAERRRIALTIAWRAAACGIPAFWRWVREQANPQVEADVVLPLLRSIIVTSYASMCDRAHLKMVRELAVTASGEAERIAKSASQAEAPVSVSNTAFAAAYATDAVAMGVNMKAVAASFDAAGFFTDGLPKPISLHGALLSSEFNEVFEDWAWIKNDLKNHDSELGSATDWSFWIWWYDGLLNGTAPAPDSQMMQDIALLPDGVWQDVDTANARINEIWRRAKGEGSEIARSTGEQEAEASMANGAVHLQKTFEQLQLDFSVLKREMAQFDSDLSEINAASKKMSSQMTKDSNVAKNELGASLDEIRSSLGEMKADLETSRQEGLSWLPNARSQLEDALATSKAAFESEVIFERPVRLWQQKFKRHSKASKEAYTRFLLGLWGSAALVLALLVTLIFASEFVSAALSPSWCDPTTAIEECSGFSLKGGLVTAGILVLFTLLLWFTRLKMKEYLAERHLALDAQERQAFASSYVRLLQSSDGSGDEVKEQRAIVYGALFRPSSSGFVKDEGGLDPSVAAAISKLLAK